METIPRLTAIIMSRFMLHLQQAKSRTTGINSSQELGTDSTALAGNSVMFERVFGSFGASISPEDFFATGGDEACDDKEERPFVDRVTGEEELGE